MQRNAGTQAEQAEEEYEKKRRTGKTQVDVMNLFNALNEKVSTLETKIESLKGLFTTLYELPGRL